MDIDIIGTDKKVVEAVAGVIKERLQQSYDYEKQVWIINGKYVRCGHPESMNCKCYGKKHAGESAIITEHCN